MKRILKIATLLLLSVLLPASIVQAQEKKSEQKVKIIVQDKGHTNVIIDTTFTNLPDVDSIILKDGKTIYLSKCPGGKAGLVNIAEGKEGVFVTVEKDGSNENEITKEICIISGDSVKIMKHSGGERMTILKSDRQSGGDGIMTWTVSEGKGEGRTVYITEGKPGLKQAEKQYHVEVRTDESGKEIEKTNYVLAKDGVVVTIEGNDEAKVKEIATMIESKLGVGKEDKEKSETVTTDVKKKVKK